ncbi:TonB-dependent receptor [Sphingomonas panacisoli]|uniref:TonB-dependent receptor n=1 Tax=Sphingomonas panacisoli TaxID=1813879 RepID=A0A5B8LKY3_9SPHN|nr:TonB-dependent receptor [Sphingomonas panacisoli]QDZ08716.1 TonB-dependent receptor [Sphingomonas panacisoli]
MSKFLTALIAVLFLMPMPAMAQEIVVTGTRMRSSGAEDTAGIGIRRRADFAVQRVTVYGDARDKEARRKEILDTVRAAIQLGDKRGIQLSYGDAVIQPLTLANYAEKLTFTKDEDRDDAEQVTFVVKTQLSDGNALAAIDRLTAFIKAVPGVGRAVMAADGEPGVSIVDPSQYRPQILAAIAADANAAAKLFGSDYAVEADNLATPVRWVLVSPTEVMLYIGHDLKIVPKR